MEADAARQRRRSKVAPEGGSARSPRKLPSTRSKRKLPDPRARRSRDLSAVDVSTTSQEEAGDGSALPLGTAASFKDKPGARDGWVASADGPGADHSVTGTLDSGAAAATATAASAAALLDDAQNGPLTSTPARQQQPTAQGASTGTKPGGLKTVLVQPTAGASQEDQEDDKPQAGSPAATAKSSRSPLSSAGSSPSVQHKPGFPGSPRASPKASPQQTASAASPQRASRLSKQDTLREDEHEAASSAASSPQMLVKGSDPQQLFANFQTLDKDARAKQLHEAKLAVEQKIAKEAERREEERLDEEHLQEEVRLRAAKEYRRSLRRRNSKRLSQMLGSDPLPTLLDVDESALVTSASFSHSVLPDVVAQEPKVTLPNDPELQPFAHADYEPMTIVVRKGVANLGFSVKEVTDAPCTLCVNNVRSVGAAALAGVKKDDLLYSVDGTDLRSLDKAGATQVLRDTGVIVTLIVGRRREGVPPPTRQQSSKQPSNNENSEPAAVIDFSIDSTGVESDKPEPEPAADEEPEGPAHVRSSLLATVSRTRAPVNDDEEEVDDDDDDDDDKQSAGSDQQDDDDEVADMDVNVNVIEPSTNEEPSEIEYPTETDETTTRIVELTADLPKIVEPVLVDTGTSPSHLAAEYLRSTLTAIRKRMDQLSQNDCVGVAEEFRSLRAVGETNPCVASKRKANAMKNRYTNVLAYDWSRVKLEIQDSDPDTDYINANYISGFESEKEYIATQGPIPSTFAAFWRMVWEQGSKIIVMLTREVEGTKRKCHRYWPDPESQPPQTKLRYGDISVKHVSTEPEAHWTCRRFTMKRGDETREVEQLLFTDWPDHGAPNDTRRFLSFRRLVREAFEPVKDQGPLVVHCGAGVGRTGTFIAIDTLLMAADNRSEQVNIRDIVANMRNSRCLMVQSDVQYIFIYRAVVDALQKLVTQAERQARLDASGSQDTFLDPFDRQRQKSVFHSADEQAALRRLQNTRPSLWTPEHVRLWLDWHQMYAYSERAVDQQIDGTQLLRMSDGTLNALGVSKLEDREYLLAAVFALEENSQRALDPHKRAASVRVAIGKNPRSQTQQNPSVAGKLRAFLAARDPKLLKIMTSHVDPTCMYKSVVIHYDTRVVDIVSAILRKCNLPGVSPSSFDLYACPKSGQKEILPSGAIVREAVDRLDTVEFEVRRRTLVLSHTGSIAIDTAVFSGQKRLVSLPVLESTTAETVVQLVLRQCRVDEDPSRFCLLEVESEADEGRQLRDDEVPLLVQTKWTGSQWLKLQRRKFLGGLVDSELVDQMRKQIATLRAEKAELSVKQQQTLAQLSDAMMLKKELARLRTEHAEAIAQRDSSQATQRVSDEAQQQLSRAQQTVATLRAEVSKLTTSTQAEAINQLQARTEELETLLGSTRQSLEEQVRMEQGLREKMEVAYLTRAQQGAKRALFLEPNLASLRASLKQTRENQDKLRQTLLQQQKQLAQQKAQLLAQETQKRIHTVLLSTGPDTVKEQARQVEQELETLKGLCESLTEEKSELERRVSALELGSTANRDGLEPTALYALAENRQIVPLVLEPQNGVLGFSVTSISVAGLLPGEVGGLRLKGVQPGGAAEVAGLRPNDVLLEVNGQSLVNASKEEGLKHFAEAGQQPVVRIVVARARPRQQANGADEGPGATEAATALEDAMPVYDNDEDIGGGDGNDDDDDLQLPGLGDDSADKHGNGRRASGSGRRGSLSAATAAAAGALSSSSSTVDKDAAEAMSARTAELEHALMHANAELESLQAELSTKDASLQETSVLVDRLRSELDASKEALELAVQAQVEQLQEAQARQRETTDDVDARVSTLERQLEESAMARSRLKAQTSREIETLSEQLSETKRSRDRLLEQFEELQQRIAALEGVVDESSRQLQMVESEKQELVERIEAANMAKEKTEAALSATVASLDADNASRGELIDKLRKELEAQKASTHSATQTIRDELNTQIADLKAQLYDVKGRASSREAQLQEQVDAAETALSDANGMIAQLKADVAARQTSIQALQVERDHLVSVVSQQMVGNDEDQIERSMVVRRSELPEDDSPEKLMSLLHAKDDDIDRLQAYVDSLTGLVIEKAPFLLEEMNRSRTESNATTR